MVFVSFIAVSDFRKQNVDCSPRGLERLEKVRMQGFSGISGHSCLEGLSVEL